jgi:PadR family transcriptional regulator AphA
MSLRIALLGLLAEHPYSGYDMMKMFDTSLANVWPATQSQLYGELNKLAGGGQVTVSAEGPRGRKEYALTDLGRAELHAWLRDDSQEQVHRSELLLRTFFLGELDPAEAEAVLGRVAERATENLALLSQLDSEIDWDGGDLAVYGRLTLEFGKRLRAMQAEWASWAVAQLRSRSS